MTLHEIQERAEKASPGPWKSDSMRSEGSYGIGDDTHEGFDTFKVTDAKGNTICDALNSDAGEVHEEYDEDGCHAWDEVARRNMDFIAHARADIPFLLSEVERLSRQVEAMREANATLLDRVEDLILARSPQHSPELWTRADHIIATVLDELIDPIRALSAGGAA